MNDKPEITSVIDIFPGDRIVDILGYKTIEADGSTTIHMTTILLASGAMMDVKPRNDRFLLAEEGTENA